MKKRMILTILAAAAFSCTAYADTADIIVNGNSLGTNGIIKDGRTLVPVRGVFEELGYTVEWQPETKTAVFENSNSVIELQSGNESFVYTDKTNNTAITITPDVPQQIIDGRFYVPLRAVSEVSGAEVSWENETKTAVINNKTTGLIQTEQPAKGDTAAVIHTNKGDIYVRLFPQYAPKAVENFTEHSKNGYYNGLIFHRVIKDFVIQGGDPTGTGRGGESIWGSDFENEVSPELRHFYGALCMANAGRDTNGSQFYIVQNHDVGALKEDLEKARSMKDERPNGSEFTYGELFPDDVIDEYLKNGGCPYLDFDYTVFGQVYSGMDVVDSIAAAATDSSDKPLEDIVIDSIEIFEY